MTNPLAFISNIVSSAASSLKSEGNSNNTAGFTFGKKVADNSGFKNTLNEFLNNKPVANAKNNNTASKPEVAKQEFNNADVNASKQIEVEVKENSAKTETELKPQLNPQTKPEAGPEKGLIAPEVFELAKQLEIAEATTPSLERPLDHLTALPKHHQISEEITELPAEVVIDEEAIAKTATETSEDPETEIEIDLPDFMPKPVTVDEQLQTLPQTSLTQVTQNTPQVNESAQLVSTDASLNTPVESHESTEAEQSAGLTVKASTENAIRGSEFQQPAWLAQALSGKAPETEKTVLPTQTPYEEPTVRKALSLNGLDIQQALPQAEVQQGIDLTHVTQAFADEALEPELQQLLNQPEPEQQQLLNQVTHVKAEQTDASNEQKTAAAQAENAAKLTVPATGKVIEAVTKGEVLPKEMQTQLVNETTEFDAKQVEVEANSKPELKSELKTDFRTSVDKIELKTENKAQPVEFKPVVSSTQQNVDLTDVDVTVELNAQTELASIEGQAEGQTSQLNTASVKPQTSQVSNFNTGLQFANNLNAINQAGSPAATLNAPQAEQVSGAMLEQLQSGKNEVTLNLSPDELGPVRIRISQGAGQQISTRMIVATSEARDVLESQMTQLKSRMEGHGVSLEKISIVVAGQAETSAEFNQNKNQSNENTQQQAEQQAQNNDSHNGSENNWSQMADALNQGGNFRNNQAAETTQQNTEEALEAENNTTLTDNENQASTYNANGEINVLV